MDAIRFSLKKFFSQKNVLVGEKFLENFALNFQVLMKNRGSLLIHGDRLNPHKNMRSLIYFSRVYVRKQFTVALKNVNLNLVKTVNLKFI